MSILTRMKEKRDDLGYATDFVSAVMKPLARDIKAKGIRVVTNAGGINPEACRDALLAVSGSLLPKDSGPPVWPPVADDILDAQPGILETHSDQAARDRKQA